MLACISVRLGLWQSSGLEIGKDNLRIAEFVPVLCRIPIVYYLPQIMKAGMSELVFALLGEQNGLTGQRIGQN